MSIDLRSEKSKRATAMEANRATAAAMNTVATAMMIEVCRNVAKPPRVRTVGKCSIVKESGKSRAARVLGLVATAVEAIEYAGKRLYSSTKMIPTALPSLRPGRRRRLVPADMRARSERCLTAGWTSGKE